MEEGLSGLKQGLFSLDSKTQTNRLFIILISFKRMKNFNKLHITCQKELLVLISDELDGILHMYPSYQ